MATSRLLLGRNFAFEMRILWPDYCSDRRISNKQDSFVSGDISMPFTITGCTFLTEEVSKNGDEHSGVLRLHFEGTPGHLTGAVCITVHFPQYVSMKSGPPAANVIIVNKRCNISQSFQCYMSPKVYMYSFPLTKVGVSIDIISLFKVWPRHNVKSTTIKSEILHFKVFLLCFITWNKFFD